MRKYERGFTAIFLLITLVTFFMAGLLLYMIYVSEDAGSELIEKVSLITSKKSQESLENTSESAKMEVVEEENNEVEFGKLLPQDGDAANVESDVSNYPTTTIYGYVKLADFACEGANLPKGTRLYTRTGLEYEVVENVRTNCSEQLQGTLTITNNSNWDDYVSILQRTTLPDAVKVKVASVETGSKYIIDEKVLMRVEGADARYFAYSDSVFAEEDISLEE